MKVCSLRHHIFVSFIQNIAMEIDTHKLAHEKFELEEKLNFIYIIGQNGNEKTFISSTFSNVDIM